MELTLEQVRKALSENPEIAFIETEKRQAGINTRDNPKTAHATPYGGAYEFIVWPLQASKNTEYLNRIFQSLPGYGITYAGDPYNSFRYTDGTLYIAHAIKVSTIIGKYETSLAFSFSREDLIEKFKSIPSTFTDKYEVLECISIKLLPSEEAAKTQPSAGWMRQEELVTLPDYPNETVPLVNTVSPQEQVAIPKKTGASKATPWIFGIVILVGLLGMTTRMAYGEKSPLLLISPIGAVVFGVLSFVHMRYPALWFRIFIIAIGITSITAQVAHIMRHHHVW